MLQCARVFILLEPENLELHPLILSPHESSHPVQHPTTRREGSIEVKLKDLPAIGTDAET